MINKRSKYKGFTLIELMIVVAIIGILAAVAIPKFSDLIAKSREANAKATMGSVRSAVTMYYGNTEGVFPTNMYEAVLNPVQDYLPAIQNLMIPGNRKTGTYFNSHQKTGQLAAGDIDQANAVGTEQFTAAGAAIGYSSTTANASWFECLHLDTKGTVWSQN